ncbi:MAG: hypothetical protein ACLQT6_04715 [Desulfomonilaceae bacterium]
MKKLWIGLLATLLLALFVAPAFAWEFKMGGQFEWRYRYIGRANGYQDLFGDMRFQDNPLNTTGQVIGFAGPNFWRGYNGANTLPMATGSWGDAVRVVKSGFAYADADASEYDQRMTFTPELRVNNAIYFMMNMDLAGIRNKYNHRDMQTNGILDRWYQDRMSQNAFDTAMIPSFNQYKLVCQLPWFLLSLGAKDFPFGTGALLGYNTRASALFAVIPYGPFLIEPGIWNSRNPEGWGDFVPYTSSGPGPNTVLDMDQGKHNVILWAVLGLYRSGPLEIGGGFIHKMLHLSSADGGTATKQIQYGPYLPTVGYQYGASDTALIVYEIYGKYNNGRFFANAEYNWAPVDVTYSGVGTVTSSTAQFSGAPPLHEEVSSFYAEAGALCGPAKLGFLLGWSSGGCLNNWNPTKVYAPLDLNGQVTDAYNYLMFHTYGGGNNAPWGTGVSFTNDENGMMADAWALAARLDYAVAANLNVWGSYMWASRVEENSTYAGQYSPYGASGTTNNTVALAQAWKLANIPGAGANANPYVDDAYLGWEAQLGVDWKLLENMSVMSRYAYWQPGPWFDQAYQVVGMNPVSGAAQGGVIETTAQRGTFMQGRSAIQAFSSSIMIDF